MDMGRWPVKRWGGSIMFNTLLSCFVVSGCVFPLQPFQRGPLLIAVLPTMDIWPNKWPWSSSPVSWGRGSNSIQLNRISMSFPWMGLPPKLLVHQGKILNILLKWMIGRYPMFSETPKCAPHPTRQPSLKLLDTAQAMGKTHSSNSIHKYFQVGSFKPYEGVLK